MKKYKKTSGFTLIEVLIALAIVSIALMGVMKVSAYHIKAAEHLKQKTLAHWVGLQAIYSIQMGLVPVPTNHEQTKMLNQSFFWSAKAVKTQVPHVRKITIKVYLNPQGYLIDVLQAFTPSQ
jgi:general secretion pathway protein I